MNIENKNDIETTTLIEQSGYSYSGISEIIRETPERKNELLFEIDKQYCELRDELIEAKKKVSILESNLSSTVSCFLYFHKVLLQDKVIDEDKLTYCKDEQNVIIHIEGENTIKYTYYKRADI